MNSKMRILVSALYFHPDHSGIALYSSDLAFYFAEQGHDVTVITGFPFYPQWQKRKEDRKRLFGTEYCRNVRILRGYLYVPRQATTLKRILHDLSFTLFAVFNFLRAGRQDCIVVLSPPLLLGVIGVIFKYLWSAQLVFHVQDFQTEAAQSLGMLRQSWLIKLINQAENFVYQHSTWVATITKGMCQLLIDRGIPKAKLDIFYNWIDVKKATKSQVANQFLNQHPELKCKFNVAYAGNIGVKQGLDILVQAADLMRHEPLVHFLIIGEGADKSRIQRIAAEKQLPNLTFLPFLAEQPYIEMLQDISASFVGQRAHTGNVFFPSKLLGIMAMAKPLLVAADLDSELSVTIANANCGLVGAADDPKTLAENIRLLANNTQLCTELGSNGRQKVQEFDRSEVLSGFLKRIVDEHERHISSSSKSQRSVFKGI